MTKPVLMIHAVADCMFDLPLDQYTLTFDDGLYSQWKHIDRLLAIDTDKYFFISTNFICETNQTTATLPSSVAHKKARLGIYEDFMTADQIRQIASYPKCYVGGHGHNHIQLSTLSRQVDKIKTIMADTTEMIDAFQKLVGSKPTSFCFPYNNDLHGMYRAILKQHGITQCFGGERIPIETLLHIPYP